MSNPHTQSADQDHNRMATRGEGKIRFDWYLAGFFGLTFLTGLVLIQVLPDLITFILFSMLVVAWPGYAFALIAAVVVWLRRKMRK